MSALTSERSRDATTESYAETADQTFDRILRREEEINRSAKRRLVAVV